MKICGLTGGVGMGKSTAAGFLQARGVKVVDTDELARQLVEPGQPALGEIISIFGKQIVTSDGQLKRAELARVVFADNAAREKLEAILHPLIRERWLARLEIWRQESAPLAVVVIPLLFETKAETFFDKILCLACSPDSQHERLRARGWMPEEICRRNAAQLPVEQKIARAHFVIWTEGVPDIHAAQLEKIFAAL
jgi:dephospho-CoA kinase